MAREIPWRALVTFNPIFRAPNAWSLRRRLPAAPPLWQDTRPPVTPITDYRKY